MQRKADYYYGAFLDVVAEARGTSAGDVEAAYGEGRVLTAGDALKANLVDEIASIDQYLNPSRDEPRANADAPVNVAAILDQAWQHRTNKTEGNNE